MNMPTWFLNFTILEHLGGLVTRPILPAKQVTIIFANGKPS